MEMSIGEISEQYCLCKDTLRRWERLGYIRPKYTEGKHRRYDPKDIEEFLMNKRTSVFLYHRHKSKMVAVDLVHVPKEGEILRLNNRCYKVEQVVHSYSQNEDAEGDQFKPAFWGLEIYIVDATEEESQKYRTKSKSQWDELDWIGHFATGGRDYREIIEKYDTFVFEEANGKKYRIKKTRVFSDGTSPCLVDGDKMLSDMDLNSNFVIFHGYKFTTSNGAEVFLVSYE